MEAHSKTRSFSELFSFLRGDEGYFPLFKRMSSNISDASEALVEMLADNSGDYAAHVERIGSIEHACDDLTHTIILKLNKSFITPFDRADIYDLSSALDDVVDLINDAARAMVMYDVRDSTEYARRFANILTRMSSQLKVVMSALERPTGIALHLIELHRLENEGDELYNAAMEELFRGKPDVITVIKWKDIYEKLEAAIDRVEHIANLVEGVLIKNT
jgi:predicted phosphate transport protein (TIGR00153 family)